MDAKKKKRAEKAQRKHGKEMEITQRVRASENQSDVEAKLESEDPTEVGGDASSFEDEGSRSIIATSVERREPTAASVDGGWEAERRGYVPAPRKCAASSDVVGELEAKRTWSPRPSEASPALSPPAPGTAG